MRKGIEVYIRQGLVYRTHMYVLSQTSKGSLYLRGRRVFKSSHNDSCSHKYCHLTEKSLNQLSKNTGILEDE